MWVGIKFAACLQPIGPSGRRCSSRSHDQFRFPSTKKKKKDSVSGSGSRSSILKYLGQRLHSNISSSCHRIDPSPASAQASPPCWVTSYLAGAFIDDRVRSKSSQPTAPSLLSVGGSLRHGSRRFRLHNQRIYSTITQVRTTQSRPPRFDFLVVNASAWVGVACPGSPRIDSQQISALNRKLSALFWPKIPMICKPNFCNTYVISMQPIVQLLFLFFRTFILPFLPVIP